MEFDKVKVRIESGTVVGESRSVNDVTQGNGPFMDKSFSGPDLPGGLPGPSGASNHDLCSPSVPQGG